MSTDICVYPTIKQVLNLSDYIERIDDTSEGDLYRIRIHFKNGYQLSVIQCWRLTYGGEDCLFEIAPFTPDGCMDGSLFDDVDKGDPVLGFCEHQKVNYYIAKIGLLPTSLYTRIKLSLTTCLKLV
jgi:hypothetical protein